MRLIVGLLLLFPLAAVGEDAPPLHLRVVADIARPAEHLLVATVELDAAPPGGAVEFRLHGGLAVTAAEGSGSLEALSTETIEWAGDAAAPIPVRTWRWTCPAGAARPTLLLRGAVHHALAAEEQEYARSFSRTPGLIDAQGVFLSGATYWLPSFDGRLVTFELTVRVPEGWDSVSQGERTLHRVADGVRETTWACAAPQEEVYLVAAPFSEFSRKAGGVTAFAFLREADTGLANKFLETTAQYIEMYRKLIGPYPFTKFAAVENFWETGYGMPSFTLLGPQVMRLPFILSSSYPHEILHNWWGNGVYVDVARGNWCEGLTAYMADHLIKEGQGQGDLYRRDTLKKYRDYVNAGKDFPLVDFRSRHSSATEAVGYGKALMLFHMLRRDVGDEAFVRALQMFYGRFRFRSAGWKDLAAVFSEVTGREWAAWFDSWTARAGAPTLNLDCRFKGDRLDSIFLRQTQSGDPWSLEVPVSLTVAGEADARWWSVPLHGVGAEFRVPAGLDVVRVDVDPLYDLFRRLDRAELPPTLGELFGAEKVTIVLPGGEDALAAAWPAVAEAWKAEHVTVVAASALDRLPPDRAVWILGSANPFAEVPQKIVEEAGEPGLRGTGRSFVYVVRHPDNPELALGWIGADNAAAMAGLARKLPHYGKYSWLAFDGDEPTNVAKGLWEPSGSPLVWMRAPGTARGRLPEREPLARPAAVYDAQALRAHVEFLADPAREGRGAGSKGLAEAIDYVARAFEQAGLKPAGDDGTWFESWSEPGGPNGAPVAMRNIVGVLHGKDAALADAAVVLGAHIDHLGLGWPDVRVGEEGKLHPGADDNASGVAVLIEVARRLAAGGHEPRRPIVFVAFDGEEWGRKGSQFYVRAMRRFPGAKSLAMVCLDTVGRLGGRPIQLLGTASASEWKHIAMGIGFTTGIASECVPADPGGSDQVSFHAVRVPAVQVFGGLHPDYHSPRDTIDKVDFDGLVQVSTFVEEMILYLGDREQPLTAAFEGATPANPAEGGAGRRASFGSMPDFAFPGPGVKVASVIEGSPAAKAGVEAGDILLRLDEEKIENLAGFSALLKARKPGDQVKVTVRRGEKELVLDATLVAR